MELALVVGPWPRAVGIVPLGGSAPLPASRVEALREAVSLVPGDARVSASNRVGAHLSARRYVYTVPVLGDANWAVVDVQDPRATAPDSPILTKRPAAIRALVRRLERDTGWSKVFEREGVVVFRGAAR